MLTLNTNTPYHFLLVHCNDYKNGVSLVLSLHCINALAEQFPHAKISFLLHSSMQDFFQNNPYIHKIFCIDTDPNIVKSLANANINISLSLVADKKSTIALFRAGIKTRIGIFSRFYSLLFNYKIKQQRTLNNKHEAEYNFDLMRFLQCKKFLYPKLYLKLSDINIAQEIIRQKFDANSQGNIDYIAICPSHGLQEIGWKSRHFFTIANTLAKFHNVLLLAPVDEMQSYQTMLQQFPNLSSKNLLLQDNTAQSNKITQILALIHLSSLFIANNNTLLHAAAALEVSTFSIFPYKNTINPYRYAPISQNTKHIICTPFGIFNPKDSYEISDYGLNTDSITPDLVLAILQTKFSLDERILVQNLPNEQIQSKTTQDNTKSAEVIANTESQTFITQDSTSTPTPQDTRLNIIDSNLTHTKPTNLIDEKG
ncbi:glycosyltransferase family 9 protein [Helicobacter trogontum]|uniref:glycosyltransferase family 9 protein n=1 Tax=Helicobacter trogontum TaxID=50960 RepID=UPI002A910E01|nr:glycosyltransferase family 9 protein [Helicobacter trogontum]MDY5184920.1 glycosyltransferase family 9 protein [Helicobacter trogontum]